MAAFVDTSVGNKLSVAEWDATTSQWTFLGGRGVSSGQVEYVSLALDWFGNPMVAFKDLTCTSMGKLTVLQWDSSTSTWAPLGLPCFSLGEVFEIQASRQNAPETRGAAAARRMVANRRV